MLKPCVLALMLAGLGRCGLRLFRKTMGVTISSLQRQVSRPSTGTDIAILILRSGLTCSPSNSSSPRSSSQKCWKS